MLKMKEAQVSRLIPSANDKIKLRDSGEDLVFLVWGEIDPENDKGHYAHASPPWWKPEIRWYDRPELPMGPASSLPRFPRPNDREVE
jgi:hypothetical protein